MFQRILIANRGEIACRIARTARRLGIETVAVYSEADRHALHVDLCDQAWCIGPAPARESYLDMARILEVAQASAVQAVHPGYGFLSENAAFARACEAAGITFVGPPASAIEAMGSKIEAKRLMGDAGVPLVPGFHGAGQSVEALQRAADEIGYPLLIKASAGGGGKGMRVVEQASAFAAALAAARREAQAAFGDDQVLLERYLTAPRHVELQIFADTQGNCIHLFERDCSIQRRLQKIIEEAPAPGMEPALRERMGAAAVAAARAVGYVGAGTVEFLLDRDGAFYFMEMNTRLQVEHPVTEMITGQDLVEWQLRVAAGEPLPLSQADLQIDGHAMEARIYAENPRQGFLPATGTIHHLRLPESSPWVRVDSGVCEGSEVGVHYDPMIAKLIVWGSDRAEARRRLRQALGAFHLAGVTTNIPFLAQVTALPAFADAELDTHFLQRHEAALFPGSSVVPAPILAMAAMYLLLRQELDTESTQADSSDPWSPWGRADGWRLNQPGYQPFSFLHEGETHRLTVHYRADGFLLELPDGELQARASITADDRLQLELEGHRLEAGVVRQGDRITLFHDRRIWLLQLQDSHADGAATQCAGGSLTAPMPGAVIAIHVQCGDRVNQGDTLMLVEAMKMEHRITAPTDGMVAEVRFSAGDQVEEGDELILLEPVGG